MREKVTVDKVGIMSREEDTMEPDYVPTCLVCGGVVERRTHSSDFVLLESEERCKRCGYYYEFVTGNSLEIIDGVEMTRSWTETPEEAHQQQVRRDELLKSARRKWNSV